MKEALYREWLADRGASAERIAECLDAVGELETFAGARGAELAAIDTATLELHLAGLIAARRNDHPTMRALTNYFRVAGPHEAFIYMTGIYGGDVLASWAERTRELAGEGAHEAVWGQAEIPPLGSPQRDYPAAAQQLIAGLQAALPDGGHRAILTGNHHRIPQDAFAELREIFLAFGIDAMLRHRHEQLVAELAEHAASGEPWWEQLISDEVVAMVRANPEIQAGVRDGDTIYVTKIPFAPQEYLAETNPTLRRYYACHCPLARASIGENGGGEVSAELCYCSAGYEKLPFDVAFGEPVEVEVLESALGGSDRCRFAIRIPGSARAARPK